MKISERLKQAKSVRVASELGMLTGNALRLMKEIVSHNKARETLYDLYNYNDTGLDKLVDELEKIQKAMK